ncbi:Uncharacterised nucleotidyltransferase [Paenibacillus uliginis N3/975]|uniref:Uncharacterized nucleotidyltransferase n=1 Tax=Paenibacillus uliginis N3/975 TaxID=1313296 RepID=A0A1X7HSF8_9BACL|nr:nucleotidyltransferase family protein [Paenibacillus uliginis]SMF92131.1 Uncharacterised nucleotidyltransferase [Paenibacillus uliginis N3/975]
MLNVMSIDKSDFSNEMSFMLLILREDIILEEETVKRYISNINWDNFLKLVTHHRVYSLMYVKLNKIGSSLIQEEVMLALRQLYKNNTVKMLQLTRELCVVCRTLNDQGIRSIVLKGPVLALHLYGELSHRTSKDLDILIDTNDVERTKKVLEKLGYCPDNTDAHLFWKKKSHHISFLHSLHSTQIEIHWRLNPDIISSPSFEELWQNKKIMVIYNQEFNHLGDEDLFAYLADHGARHGWFRLRWLIDIDRLVKNQIDIPRLNNHFKLYGGRIYVEQAVLLSNLLLSSKIPLDIQSLLISRKSIKLAQMALDGIKNSPNVEEGFTSKYKQSINSVLTGRQKTLLLLKRLLPSSLDAEILPLPRSFSFLYFPLRPFLWFWRLMKRT